jgi:hypothetical protein
MSDEKTEEIQQDEVPKKFARIVGDVQDGRDLHNDDAQLLLGIIGGLDQNFAVSNMMLETLLGTITDMCQKLGVDVLRRAGRTDKKIRRSVEKMVTGEVENLFSFTKARAEEYMNIVRSMNDTPEEDTNVG